MKVMMILFITDPKIGIAFTWANFSELKYNKKSTKKFYSITSEMPSWKIRN